MYQKELELVQSLVDSLLASSWCSFFTSVRFPECPSSTTLDLLLVFLDAVRLLSGVRRAEPGPSRGRAAGAQDVRLADERGERSKESGTPWATAECNGRVCPTFLPARGAAALAAVWCVELMRCTTRIYLVYLRVPVGALPLPSGVSWPLEVSPAFTAPSPVRF